MDWLNCFGKCIKYNEQIRKQPSLPFMSYVHMCSGSNNICMTMLFLQKHFCLRCACLVTITLSVFHVLCVYPQEAVRNSVCHSATVISNAFMHCGTTSDQFLRWLILVFYLVNNRFSYTVKPVLSSHTREAQKVAAYGRWLNRGEYQYKHLGTFCLAA